MTVKSPEISPLKPAAWVLPGESNAIENCAHSNERLAVILGQVNVRFIALLSLFGHTQRALIVEEMTVKSPEISPLKPAAWVLPG